MICFPLNSQRGSNFFFFSFCYVNKPSRENNLTFPFTSSISYFLYSFHPFILFPSGFFLSFAPFFQFALTKNHWSLKNVNTACYFYWSLFSITFLISCAVLCSLLLHSSIPALALSLILPFMTSGLGNLFLVYQSLIMLPFFRKPFWIRKKGYCLVSSHYLYPSLSAFPYLIDNCPSQLCLHQSSSS